MLLCHLIALMIDVRLHMISDNVADQARRQGTRPTIGKTCLSIIHQSTLLA